jgi:hypothetical protein
MSKEVDRAKEISSAVVHLLRAGGYDIPCGNVTGNAHIDFDAGGQAIWNALNILEKESLLRHPVLHSPLYKLISILNWREFEIGKYKGDKLTLNIKE